jgi:hypothetical protein
MANPLWPVDLPQDVFVDGYDEKFPNAVLRTDMDAGPPKQRRRFTAAVKPMTVVVGLTRDQVESLESFFEDTLGMGAISFDWVHPRTQADVTLRFVGGTPPEVKPEPGAARWQATLTLEVMP